MTDEFRIPRDDEHCLIVGKTGTGKSHAGVWQLSLRSYDIRPWIIVDVKGDDFIAEIDAHELSLHGAIPKEPGLYVVRPDVTDEKAIDDFLLRIFRTEGVGTFIDEGYAIGARNRGYRLLLMQGRSKICPVISLSQRPVFLDRYAVSEPSHYQVFRLNDKRDWDTIAGFAPGITQSNPHYKADRHNSLWYDVGADKVYRLSAVPDRDTILQTIEDRRPTKKERWL